MVAHGLVDGFELRADGRVMKVACNELGLEDFGAYVRELGAEIKPFL